jgi:excisionase family DNA binding protein
MRVQTGIAAKILGVSKRTVQALVVRGELPACRVGAKLFTFDPVELKAYLEARRCRKTFTAETASSGCALPPTDEKRAILYERAMSKMRGGSGTSASRKSTPLHIVARSDTPGKRR